MPAAIELSLRFALKSHAGKVRPHNEDAVGADPSIGLFILADGLGGYNAGEVASTMAVSNLLARLGAGLSRAHELREAHPGTGSTFDPAHALRESLIDLNDTVFRSALNSSQFEGMATTVVIAWFLGGKLWVAHAGDSRLYRLRDGELTQITKDHSFSQELLDAGMISPEDARNLPAKNLVTRAVGASPTLDPEVHEYDVQPRDLLLLCSDGLTEMAADPIISELLRAHPDDIAGCARHLIDAANLAGGRDNVSVILVRVDEVPPSPDDAAFLAAEDTAELSPDEAPATDDAPAGASPADEPPAGEVAAKGSPR